MIYPEVVQYLESFVNYEKTPAYPYQESLKLERIKDFLKIIGNPQDSLRCIHVAGSKGKGSTCAFLTYILREAGFKVGLYTSPHLSDFRERIRILEPNTNRQNSHCEEPEAIPHLSLRSAAGAEAISKTGSEQAVQYQKRDCFAPSGLAMTNEFEGMISRNELIDLVERLKPAIEKYNKNSKYGPLTFFEVYTALAFIYFKEKKVDLTVLETGLGGRLDATNMVDPLVCAITPVSYEHTDKLGRTLRKIAAEKAGIIKTHRPSSLVPRPSIVITAPQEKEALKVIRARCQEAKAKLYEVGRDIFYERVGNRFNVLGIFGEYPHLEIQLLGEHQLVNASVAIGVSEILRFHDIIIGSESIREGLRNAFWPARCEIIAKDPYLILDGAQNAASARALKETIKENFQYKRLILILGICSDKDIKGISGELGGIADTIVLTKADNSRATEPKILANYFKGKEVFITRNVKEAKVEALKMAKKEDLILVTGSLFVAGEAREQFKQEG